SRVSFLWIRNRSAAMTVRIPAMVTDHTRGETDNVCTSSGHETSAGGLSRPGRARAAEPGPVRTGRNVGDRARGYSPPPSTSTQPPPVRFHHEPPYSDSPKSRAPGDGARARRDRSRQPRRVGQIPVAGSRHALKDGGGHL